MKSDAPARVAPQRNWKGARHLRSGHTLYWWAELIAIGAFYGAYSAVRDAANAEPRVAFHHAQQIIGWQRSLGIFHEEALQRLAMHFTPLIVGANYYYGSLHFIVTIGVGVFLFRRWSDDYPRWRNTLAVATALALVGFHFWPLMPPRLLHTQLGGARYHFVDTLAKYPTFWSFESGAMSKLSNQFAAMPSVHCAWSLFCACALVPRVRTMGAKVLAALYPVVTVIVIVITANHYFLDAVAGFAIFGIGYVVGRLVTRAGRVPVGAASG